MSDHVPRRPEQEALAELTRLVRNMAAELAGYRKRAHSAESRLKALDELAARSGASPERAFELEEENAQLRARLEAAQARTQVMLERVKFLRQQHST